MNEKNKEATEWEIVSNSIFCYVANMPPGEEDIYDIFNQWSSTFGLKIQHRRNMTRALDLISNVKKSNQITKMMLFM